MDFDKNIVSSMPVVDVDSISLHLEIPKEIIEKHGNGADEIMDVSSDEDNDEEIEDPERIKSASDALQVMDKVIWFFYQFDNKALLESVVKVIKSLQDLQILRRPQTKITTYFTKNKRPCSDKSVVFLF